LVESDWLLISLIDGGSASETAGRWETEFVDFGEVEPDSGATVVPSGAQRTLVYAREMGLLMKESIEGVVAPIGTKDASVASTRSIGLEHTLEGSGWGNDSSSLSSVVLIRIF
jgi:hypothetical protein